MCNYGSVPPPSGHRSTVATPLRLKKGPIHASPAKRCKTPVPQSAVHLKGKPGNLTLVLSILTLFSWQKCRGRKCQLHLKRNGLGQGSGQTRTVPWTNWTRPWTSRDLCLGQPGPFRLIPQQYKNQQFTYGVVSEEVFAESLRKFCGKFAKISQKYLLLRQERVLRAEILRKFADNRTTP